MKFEYYEELHNYITTHHNNHKPQLVSDTETRGNEDNYCRRKDVEFHRYRHTDTDTDTDTGKGFIPIPIPIPIPG